MTGCNITLSRPSCSPSSPTPGAPFSIGGGMIVGNDCGGQDLRFRLFFTVGGERRGQSVWITACSGVGHLDSGSPGTGVWADAASYTTREFPTSTSGDAVVIQWECNDQGTCQELVQTQRTVYVVGSAPLDQK